MWQVCDLQGNCERSPSLGLAAVLLGAESKAAINNWKGKSCPWSGRMSDSSRDVTVFQERVDPPQWSLVNMKATGSLHI